MRRQSEQDAIYRLIDLDFYESELDALSQLGWPPERVLMAVNELFDAGSATEGTVALAFQEMHPELYQKASAAQAHTPRAAADFGEDRTDFLWYPYIPRGDYTVLMAPGGTGKTCFICAVAAAVSSGAALPGDESPEGPERVLLISAEDRGELLKKRLRASGAALEQVYILDCTDSAGLNITDGWEHFREVVSSLTPGLIVLDPWHGFLGADIDINRVNAVRPVFQRLANLAKELGSALILVSHVNKRAQSENVNFAATGSTDFVNAARSALYLIYDPEDEDARVVVHTKSNYARSGESVRFRITAQSGAVWAGWSEIGRDTLEEAARRRRTVGELLRSRAEDERVNDRLVAALMEEANPYAVVRFSYAEFKEKYGETIFGSAQPKRALEAVADTLFGRGFEVKAGVHVRDGDGMQRGFTIAGMGNELRT